MKKLRVFVSSVQKELVEERRAVKEFIIHDPLLSRLRWSLIMLQPQVVHGWCL